MKVYLVGGAVRNRLLNLPISDYDWVIVGAEQYDLIKLGFRKVGKDFPVFLHPKTKEEYALARIEKKIKDGHTGFFCSFNSSITIEEDLSRRDLTVNAIAISSNGVIIDPFNGFSDIKNRILRHVSCSFVEDPLRILRIARFFSQLSKEGFIIANETKFLIRKMVENQELKTISSERVWKETEKALSSFSPDLYFNILYQFNALFILIPEMFFKSFFVNDFFKKEFNTYPFLILKETIRLTQDIGVRFSAFCCDVVNNLNNMNKKLFFLKKKFNSVLIVNEICNRLLVPNKFKELAILSVLFCKRIQKINYSEPKKIIHLFNKTDFWRRPGRFLQLLIIFKAEFLSKKKNYNIDLKYNFFFQISQEFQKKSNKIFFFKKNDSFKIKKIINTHRIKVLNKFLRKKFF